MKEKIKSIIPKRLLDYYGNVKKSSDASLYMDDLRRFMKHSAMFKEDTPEKLKAKILLRTHTIEKAFSLPNTKDSFGKDAMLQLLALLETYERMKLSRTDPIYKSAMSAINEYVKHHSRRNSPDELIIKKLRGLRFSPSDECIIRKIPKTEYIKSAQSSFADFAQSRCSIRDYSTTTVRINQLRKALRIANKYPSVCNRQCARVHIIENKAIMKEILTMQNGNRGFGHLADKLLVITSDLSCFYDLKERNQAYIDGGLYSMNLLFSLHHIGLGACPLNWFATKKQDRKIRQIAHIPDNETIIMLITVGHLKDEVKVVSSGRRNINDITRIVK